MPSRFSRASRNNQRRPRHTTSFNSRLRGPLKFERLEPRQLLTANLTLAGTQTVIHNANIDASNAAATQQQNLAIDINPTNPLHVSGVSEKNSPTVGTLLGLYRSSNGGVTWTTTTIDDSIDHLGVGARRFDPSVAYDADGNLYVSYIAEDGTTSTLVVATSTNDGASFSHVISVEAVPLGLAIFAGTNLGTGPDGLGNQAVYVASTLDTFLGNGIVVSGSNDGGATFTSPTTVSDSNTHNFTNGDPSVGPSGQLYVSWFDSTDNAVRFDRDTDGLFAAVNNFGGDITVVDNTTARPVGGGFFTLFSNHAVAASPHGISSAPELDTDQNGVNLYISFADLFSSATDDTDVWVARSINGGAAWTLIPVRRSSATEFMPWVDVDQSSGSVNVEYYSTIGDAVGNNDVNVMLASSIDGGSNYVVDQQLTTATSEGSAITGANSLGDYIGLAVHDGTVQALWADNRGTSTDAEAFTASASFSSGTNGNVLNVLGTIAGDTITIRRSAANHTFLEVVVNGQLQYAGLIATLDSSGVQSLAGSDTLTIDNSNGIVNLPFNYDGGTSLFDNDRLAITGNPGSPVARETYIVGGTLGTGIWVLDPDGSQGPGLTGSASGDELTVTFLNLEPVDSDTPAVAFDTIMNTMPNDATVQNGGLLGGVNSLQVTDNNSTFETFRFANKTNVRIMGQSGADTITVNYTIAAAGLTNLQIDGHVAPDVLGQPADDNAADNLKVFRNAAGVIYMLAGQGGNDNFIVGNGDLSVILASVAAVGGDGTDGITVDDSARVIPVNYLFDPGKITIRTSVGPPPVDILITHYDGTMENVQLDGTQAPNQFDVVPSIFATYFVNGHLPTSAGPGADILVLHTAGTTGRVLTYNPVTGDGNWMFAPPTKTVNFTSIEQLKFAPMLVYAAEAAANGKPTVKVVDAETGGLITSFLAYEANYTQGVRVAVGDVNNDGIPEIITAPGRNHNALIEVWNIASADLATPPTLLESFVAYPAAYKGGAMVAVGDVNGDKLNDLVVAPSRGQSQIHTYINQFATTPATPLDTVHQLDFLAFNKSFIGGASVAVGDVEGDASAEIIVGSGSGMRDNVLVFKGDTSVPVTTLASPLQTILPFQNNARGGVLVATANIDADPFLEIVVGAGIGGGSQMATYDITNLTTPVNSFILYTGNGSNAPLRVAGLNQVDGSGNVTSTIVTAQGPDGISQELRHLAPAGPPVDFLFDNDVEFRDGFYVSSSLS